MSELTPNQQGRLATHGLTSSWSTSKECWIIWEAGRWKDLVDPEDIEVYVDTLDKR